MQYKLKHRLSAALMAGAMCCTMIPAASAEEISTPEIADTFVPEITDSVTPDLSQITENLYNDLPDAPTGSYLGSMGLPVATGETKISISSWGSDLYDGEDAHMDADALNADESNITVGKTPDANYAVVPLLVQTEYPADGAASEIILPDGVELLSYASTDYDLISANKAELAQILHQTYAEQSAAATGFYVKASADFTAQFVYTAPDGEQLQKSLHVQLSDEAAPTQLYADNGIATLAAGPTPPYATGKITSIAKEGGTWLIWFNGQEAYCCSHGLNGQPNGCPTYTFDHVSRLEPGQYTPGNHYANQINIWGGLGQLSLDMLDSKPVVMSADTEQPDLISEIYDETQQWIITNYPDSYAAQAYVAAAEELADGTRTITPTLPRPTAVVRSSTPARASSQLHLAVAMRIRPIPPILQVLPATRIPTPCTPMSTPCRTTALSAASLSPKQTLMPPGIWLRAATVTARLKVPCTTCMPPRTFFIRTAFPALSITPRSPIPAATPSGIPPCLPTAHGSPTISRC